MRLSEVTARKGHYSHLHGADRKMRFSSVLSFFLLQRRKFRIGLIVHWKENFKRIRLIYSKHRQFLYKFVRNAIFKALPKGIDGDA